MYQRLLAPFIYKSCQHITILMKVSHKLYEEQRWVWDRQDLMLRYKTCCVLDATLQDLMCVLFSPATKLPVLREDSQKFLVVAAVVMEQIWKGRNRVLFESWSFNIVEVAVTVQSRVSEFLNARQFMEKRTRVGSGSMIQRWVPPPEHCIKFNVDAAVVNGVSVLAYVARDTFSKVVLIRTCHEEISNVQAAETKAILLASQDALRVIVEWLKLSRMLN